MADFGSFSDLAGIKGNTIEKPKKLPTAPYIAVITGPFKEHKSKQKGTLAAQFPVRLQGSLDEEIQANIAGDEKLTKALDREFPLNFWLTGDSLWRVTEFAKAMGLDADNMDLLEILEAIAGLGTPFLVQGTLDHSNSEDGFFSIDNPAPLPE